MTAVMPKTQEIHPARVNVAFSANGRWGACVRVEDEELTLEHWALTPGHAQPRPIPYVSIDRRARPLPLDDGRILLLRSDGNGTSGRHTIVLLVPGEQRILRQRLADIPALGAHLVPGPLAGQLGLLITIDNPEHSTIWQLSSALPHAEPILRIPGSLAGGVWLDPDQGLLAINRSSGAHPSSGIVVDVRQRSWRRIWSVSELSIDRIVLASPRSKLLVITTSSAGQDRLGWARLGDPTVHFPETLHRAGYARHALALDEPGEQLLLREVSGAVSRLLIYRPSSDALIPIPGPLGTISAPANWTGDVIRFRFSAPHQPPALAAVQLNGPPQLGAAPPRWSVSQDEPPIGQPPRARAELIELPGPAGPIEAITYGGPAWRNCPHLVVALHGGPLAAWRLEFDPFFQALAQAGVAVVAPNYRGSTGYGDAHLRAVVGNWGGPDLEDVLYLGRMLARQRGRRLRKPVVLGSSYGAFLALLAASAESALWSACVALAPFMSGPSLHSCADAVVRQRIENLGGLAHTTADVLASCDSLAAPLLLVHGTRDTTIPMAQSRLLRERLSGLGRTEGIDFEYLETTHDHEEVAMAWPRDLRQRIVSFCLAGSQGR